MADYKVKITENEYLPLRDVVFNTIKDGILTGRLKPGERLLENQLAEELGVSRTPIREALRMLEIEKMCIRDSGKILLRQFRRIAQYADVFSRTAK